MITRAEIKIFVIALGKRWLFPDFTNKLTWLVVSVGATIILTPIAFKQIIYNWLVANFNLNSGIPFTLADFGSSSADYSLGFGLIALALTHNIVNRYFIFKATENDAVAKKELIDVDRAMFQLFLSDFPSNGQSVMLLELHDFSNSHHGSSTKDIERFVSHWNTAERMFLDKDIESKRQELWIKCSSFIHELARNSYSIGDGETYSCIPDTYRTGWELPERVEHKLRELNEKATECFELHQAFVLLGRSKLHC